jgi:ubiquinone/menaquinone biosynthesis C-methylase UbiE
MFNRACQQDKIEERIFFNQFSEGSYDIFTPSAYRKLLNILKEKINLHSNPKILDLGCGSGAFTKYLLNLNGKIFGLDICHNLIRKAEFKGRINFITGDIENLPFRDGSFDIVFFSNVLHHFPDLTLPLKEAYRILKKDGHCFAIDPNNKNPVVWTFRNRKSLFFVRGETTLNERPLSGKEIKEVLLENGFKKIDIFSVCGMPARYIKNKILRIFLPIYNLFDYILGKIDPLSKRYGAFLLTCGQK